MTTMTTMWILGAVFALVGVPFVWLARRTFARDRLIAGWPRTDGVMTSARLETSSQKYTESNGIDYWRTVYTPRVTYTYSVDGQPFEGTGIARSIDGMLTTQDSAQKYLDKYPARKKVTVFYNPADPKVAYLELRRSAGAIFLLVFGSFWIALGALLVALSFI